MKIDEIANRIDRVSRHLYLSGAISDYDKLYEMGINIVINCRAEQHDDIVELTRRGIAYYWIPIMDFNGPRFDQLDSFIGILKENIETKRILVHCAVGVGRSAMLVLSYNMVMNKTPIERAIEELKDVRQIVVLSEVQEKKLRKYLKYLSNDRDIEKVV